MCVALVVRKMVRSANGCACRNALTAA
eukprot:COSAG02_NODE_49558_length_326_cov_0.678414_1_plen_26_part_01